MKTTFSNILLYFISLTPNFIFVFLIKILATLMSFLSSKDINLITKNIQLTKFQHGYNSDRLFIKSCFYHQMISAIECIKSLYGKKIKIEGYEDFQKLFSDKKSTIIATAHTGNWEVMNRYLSKASPKPTHVLAKPSKSEFFNLTLNMLRVKSGSKVIWVNKKSYFKKILEQIKRGNTVGFVMDQKSQNRAGPQVLFFNHRTDFVSGPANIAHKYELPILSCFAMRVGSYHYKIIAEKISLAADETATTQAIASKFEEIIRDYPDQWVWNYRKWPQANY